MILNKKYPETRFDKLTCADCYLATRWNTKKPIPCSDSDTCTREFVYEKAVLPWYEAFCISMDRYIDFVSGLEIDRNSSYCHYYGTEWLVVLKEDIFNISTNILDRCSPKITNMINVIFPRKFWEMLMWIKDFAYETELVNYDEIKNYINVKPITTYKLLSLEEQQQKCKEYYHFDFSVKKPKVLKPGGINSARLQMV